MSRSSDHKLIPHPDSQAPSAPPVGEYLQQATSEKNPINPPYPEPPPPYSLQAPTYNQPAPTYNQPAPAYNQPAPTYNQPAPAYNQPAPTCNQPAPTCNQPAPVSMAGMYGQPSPAQAVGAYPQQAPATTVVIAQQPMVPVNTQPTPVILVGTQALPPGTCKRQDKEESIMLYVGVLHFALALFYYSRNHCIFLLCSKAQVYSLWLLPIILLMMIKVDVSHMGKLL
ncbi:DNA-directed RNA polymerase II subunit RPB1-like 19, partial [Homarus americanus]